jgi:hypothetical protein
MSNSTSNSTPIASTSQFSDDTTSNKTASASGSAPTTEKSSSKSSPVTYSSPDTKINSGMRNDSGTQTSTTGSNSTGSSKTAPQSVGGDQPVGTNSKEVVKENKMSQLAKLVRGLLFSIIHLIAEIGNALLIADDEYNIWPFPISLSRIIPG